MNETAIDRGFVRLSHGLVHYRAAGAAIEAASLPLIMAHGGPGSSAGLAPLIRALGANRRVFAPDMMGNGESDPPPGPTTDIVFYADCLLDILDRFDLERVDVYGHHTGAQVVCELAIAQPHRVRRVILDGAALFPLAQRREFLARYAPKIEPDDKGGHLAALWDFTVNLTQYFPYYHRDAAHRVPDGAPMPSAAATNMIAEILRSWQTYHLAYRAAFEHDFAARLPHLRAPCLVLAVAGDPLAEYAETAASLAPMGQWAATNRLARADAIEAFLTA